MLAPKKVKHRKWHKGRSKNRLVETRGTTVAYGDFGLRAEGAAWITSHQIESVRRSMTHYLKREGSVYIRIFPDKPVTQRPPEVTMGGGKGAVDHYVFPVRPGRILFELGGVDEKRARQAFKLGSYKLPIKTRMVARDH